MPPTPSGRPRPARPARLARTEIVLAAGPLAPAAIPARPKGAGGPAVLAVPLAPGPDGPVPGPGAAALAAAYGVDLGRLAAAEAATGEAGQVVGYPLLGEGSVTRLLLAGVGDGSPGALRRTGAALARRCRGEARLVTTVLDAAGGPTDRATGRAATPADWAADGAAALRAFVEGLVLGGYTFHRRSTPKGSAPLGWAQVVVPHPHQRQAALDRALAVADAVWLARDLANTPPNEKSPHWMAAQAQQLARAAGLVCRVRDEEALAAEGFGGILAVGGGSARAPRLVELRYDPGVPARHVVLVGKGITFDSGGLSLKPRDSMPAMKTDMAGGAVVYAVLGLAARLGWPLRLTGLVPVADNVPSGSAARPGDVVRHYGGRTTEVLNTDAEGRLVLGDALAYAVAELAPDVLVDVATLTGAATAGLGRRHGALYATDEALARDLLAAGEDSGDRLWRMPLVADYRPALASPVADAANIATDPHVHGGSITAALFLQGFVGDRPWAHLDIAGPARADADEHEVSKGATGFGVRVLAHWLEQGGPRRTGRRRTGR
ncbi:MAG: leucyl aminopeptidase family protein [Actinomycetota bacterium]